MISCPYCGNDAVLVDSKEVYGRSYGMLWLCRPCDAYVGCHKNSDNKPLGRLANKELRQWKIKAHAVFDPMWEGKMRRDKCSKGEARKSGYLWLAGQLMIPVENCHIGMMNVELCRRVVDVVTNRRKGNIT